MTSAWTALSRSACPEEESHVASIRAAIAVRLKPAPITLERGVHRLAVARRLSVPGGDTPDKHERADHTDAERLI